MLTRQFTDAYGVTHAAAVFEIDNVNVNNHSHRRIFVDKEDPAQPIKEEEATVYSVEFGARFWTSKEAKEQGKLSMPFISYDSVNKFEQGTFEVTFTENPIALAQATIIQKAESKLVELITQGQE